MDKPEQALELLQEATRMAGRELNTDVGVIIDVGADRLFDQVGNHPRVFVSTQKKKEDANFKNLSTSKPFL